MSGEINYIVSRFVYIFVSILFLFSSILSYGQQVDVANIGKQFTSPNPLKVRGSISANSVGYTGNSSYGRDPLSYHINGNLNISLFQQINMPFSFNFTNAGSRYSYPTLPNRLSLHPTYKSVKAHIGDVSMTFSPYTLNGIQFRGVGVDIEPGDTPWRFSAMYGRLQKAVEYDPKQEFITPTYKRMGYSSKIGYEAANYQFGLTFFSGNDDESSLNYSPDSLAIVPARNLAISGTASFKIGKDFTLKGEYAISSLTRDKRSNMYGNTSSNIEPSDGRNLTKGTYDAWKTNLDYRLRKSVVGLGYERVAPGYETLGAYYFSNDFENFTLNYMQPLLQDKVNIGINLGLQKDDLKKQKSSRTSRFIGAANLNVTPFQQFQANLTYSNFQTHVNIKPQFDYINAPDQFYQADTLNFVQLSQNANANINYVLRNSDKISQNLNVNLTYQVASDEQGGIVQKENSSGFYSGMASYNLGLPSHSLQISTAFNYTHNTIGRQDTRTLGPTISLNKKFLENKITTGLSTSYNTSVSSSIAKTEFLNLRGSVSYTLLKKHNLGLSIINQNRKIGLKGRTNDLTATLSYNYAFSMDNFWTRKSERSPSVKKSTSKLSNDVIQSDKLLGDNVFLKEQIAVKGPEKNMVFETSGPDHIVNNNKRMIANNESLPLLKTTDGDNGNSPLRKNSDLVSHDNIDTDSIFQQTVSSISQEELFQAMLELKNIAERYLKTGGSDIKKLSSELQKVHIDYGPNEYRGQSILPEESTYFYIVNVFDSRINMPPSRYGVGQFNRTRYRKKGVNHYIRDVNGEHQLLYVGPFYDREEAFSYQSQIGPFMPEIMKIPQDMYNVFIITKPFLETLTDSFALFHYYQYYLEMIENIERHKSK